VLGLVLIVAGCAAKADTLRCPAKVTTMEMGKGQYSPMPGAVFELQNFSAAMTSRGNTSPLCYNRTTNISHGQVFISSSSLTHLFEQKIEQSESKIKDVKVEIKDNLAHLTGTMKKGVDVHFEISGPVSTDGTVLILKAKKISADGIPMKMLLGMVGEHLGNLLGSESVEGVKAQGDTLIFVPALISHVTGKITKLELTNAGLKLDFEGAPAKKQVVAGVSKVAKTAGSK
jgi:uncharacterized membrane protein YeaQ/YmgE (transglycosylase-associated protein family)